MLSFRDLLVCAFVSTMALWCSTPAMGQQSESSSLSTPQAGADLDLSRLALWLDAGAGRKQIGPTLFEVPVGASQTGYVSLGALPDGPNPLLPAGMAGTAVLVRIFVPATGHDEVFLLYVPGTDPSVERPLLTGFHSYGSSHGTIATLTGFLREAEVREWFLVAPIQSGGPGYSQVSYGTVQSQEHVEAVLSLLLGYYSIDRDRLYGVGFSMGGGNVTGYAARHRDRRTGSFAAIVNHTGTVSLGDTYQFVEPSVKTIMEALFMGPPSQNPFDWTRASSIVLDGNSQLMAGADHMAINLTTTPVKTIYGITDSRAYLVNQSIQLDEFFTSVGATNHILEPTVVPMGCQDGHCWDTADEVLVCDWFEPITLDSTPPSGTILTDRAVRWGRFDVTPDVASEFTQVDFEVDVASNSLTFRGVRNLREISVDPTRVGLNLTTPITFNVESTEAGGDLYRLRAFPSVPLLVVRNSQQITSACPSTSTTASWCIDTTTGDFVLSEPGGTGAATWRIHL